ncbi:MAG: OmpH family outer membrane protein [Pseudomonadota bacterium]
MSKASKLGILVLGLALFGVIGAKAAGPPAAKVGYVDLQRTLNETKIGRAARDRLETEKSRRQKEIDERQNALKKEKDELDKQRVLLKPEVLREREKDFQDRYIALQETFMRSQQELAKKEGELTRDIFLRASKIIETIAKRDGFTIMLEKNESAVLYADPTTDITAEVNRRLDEEGK